MWIYDDGTALRNVLAYTSQSHELSICNSLDRIKRAVSLKGLMMLPEISDLIFRLKRSTHI